MEEPEDLAKYNLPYWAKESLRTLFLITVVVVLAILMFYKGMIFQCNELGYDAYATGDGWIGFSCEKQPPHQATGYTKQFPLNINLSQKYLEHMIIGV